MALATQCPHCQTTFRVAQDQLKLRAGLVRCGACKQIFNGIENLLPSEQPEQKSTLTNPTSPPEENLSAAPVEDSPSVADRETTTVSDSPGPSEVEDMADISPQPDFEDAGEATEVQEAPDIEADDKTDADPLLRMTLMEVTQMQQEPAVEDSDQTSPPKSDEPDPLEAVIDDLQLKPWREEQPSTTEEDEDTDELDRTEAADYEEPRFVKQARRQQRLGRLLRVLMGSGTLLLLIALLAQSAYVFRDRLAASFPETKPVLDQVCSYLRCQVNLPMQIESLSVESSELQTLAANGTTFALTLLLRNRGVTDQAWPHVELTLNDASDKPIARRVFTPREYLTAPEQELQQGFQARSEQTVKLHFQLTQLKASGYRVYLFYP